MRELTEGQKLRIARLTGDITLSQFAERLGFTQAHISKMESNERNVPAQAQSIMLVELMLADYWYTHIQNALEQIYPDSAEDIVDMLDIVLGLKPKH